VRSAVNIDDQRMFRSGRHTASGFNEERFDVIFIVIADEHERFHVGDLLAAEQIGIQVGQLFRIRAIGGDRPPPCHAVPANV